MRFDMKLRLSLALIMIILMNIAGAAQVRRGTAGDAEQKAVDSILRGQFREAATVAAAALKSRPGNARLRVLLARAEMGQGNLQTAYAELRRALEIDSRNIDAIYYIALVSEALAPMEYDRLYRLNPNSDRVHQILAESALAQENKAEAEAEYLAAIRINPRALDSILGLAELKRSQSKFDEALRIYRNAEALIGLNHDIAYGIGVCYGYLQDHPRAIEYFRKAIGFEPQAEATLFALGNSLFQNGQLVEAIDPLKTAVAINPKIKQAYFLLGRAYQRLGQRELAREAFKRVDELTQEELKKERNPESRISPPKK